MLLNEDDWNLLNNELHRMAAYIQRGQRAFIAGAIRRALSTGQLFNAYQGREELDGLAAAAFYNSLAAVPPEQRRAFCIAFYASPGQPNRGHLACERVIRKLPRRGVEELPEELRAREFLTVYRAGRDPVHQAGRRLSWSLSLDVVEHYINGDVRRAPSTEATMVYRAEIRPRDVIAYFNDLENAEILQYNAVRDIAIYDCIDVY